jgi:hypothetical protein
LFHVSILRFLMTRAPRDVHLGSWSDHALHGELAGSLSIRVSAIVGYRYAVRSGNHGGYWDDSPEMRGPADLDRCRNACTTDLSVYCALNL